MCGRHYRPGGALFFYVGNEADVTLYLNNTGLMWELAPRHHALLVFAEHRFYGASQPFPAAELRRPANMAFLTSEQAMADYAGLLWDLKQELKDPDVPVVGFGGSYGGMLATWFRMKYPHLMSGAIAASAPIWTYLGEEPPYQTGSFAAIVTRDATPRGGSAEECAPNVRVRFVHVHVHGHGRARAMQHSSGRDRAAPPCPCLTPAPVPGRDPAPQAAWATLFEWGADAEGRAAAARAMRLCGGADALTSPQDVQDLALWAQNAWDYMAMGDYPYSSSYIINGAGELPAFPVRAACAPLAGAGLRGEALLGALADAVGVFYNFSGADLKCFDFRAGSDNETEADADFWGYQYCTEQWQPFSRDGNADMFWGQPWDAGAAAAACEAEWGVRPRPMKATIEWGGRRIGAASNIVFSNGGLDPWSSGGVLSSLSDSLVAVFIPEGAHHLDLFFSHPDDPPSVVAARRLEERHIETWIREARAAAAARGGGARLAAGGARQQGLRPTAAA